MGIDNLFKLYVALKERAHGGGLLSLNYKEVAIMNYVEEQIYLRITPMGATASEVAKKQYTGPGILGRAI